MPAPQSTDLQIVALLRYVDACASGPTPHADCPVAAAMAARPSSCLSACRETLSGLLRRGRSATSSAPQDFDARQILLSEPASAPDALWHTSSLLQEVARTVGSHPYGASGRYILKREVFGTSALGALGQRGIDPEALIRYGLGDRVKLGIASWLARLERAPDARATAWPHHEDWRQIFGVTEEGGSPGVGRYFDSAIRGSAQRYFDSWLATAPLPDLLAWRPSPTASGAVRRETEQVERWQWLVDRFTQTYLHSWSFSSLKQEYSFLTGQADAGFSLDVLQERAVPVERVARAIADAAVADDGGIDPRVVGALTEQAVELLQGGERTAAAALFEAARTFKPGDATLRNNYAFCILIDRPDEARLLLEDALAMKVSSRAVTLCNLMLAHHLLGDNTIALKLANDAYDAGESYLTGAYLWQADESGEWAVRHILPQIWVAQLGASIERRLGTLGRWSHIMGAAGPTPEPS